MTDDVMSEAGAGDYCSFCARTEAEAGHLVAGPTARICQECARTSVAVFDKRAALGQEANHDQG